MQLIWLSVKTRQGKDQGILNLQYHSLFKCHKTTNHIMLVLGYVSLNIIKYSWNLSIYKFLFISLNTVCVFVCMFMWYLWLEWWLEFLMKFTVRAYLAWHIVQNAWLSILASYQPYFLCKSFNIFITCVVICRIGWWQFMKYFGDKWINICKVLWLRLGT